ncbi:hypothetical protein L2725_00470 [Shewanella corallii]|uniref:Tetratricopeptide repeat protein n=1 Tax=Shewanella corallii TaxID=560080 RepID=A0ABT0N1G7_9GAMM|nr:hypothetical protein [Shewanella corallii]MCL2912266.1 hypothetical protein [Shewanella corallii]
MSKDELNLIAMVIGFPLLLILTIFYYSSPQFSQCYRCHKQISHRKQKRYWVNVDGNNHALCSSCFKKSQKCSVPITQPIKSGPTSTEMSQPVRQDWHGGDLKSLEKALVFERNDLERHFILNAIVNLTYCDRKLSISRQKCIEASKQSILNTPKVLPNLKQIAGVTPRVPSFQYLATIYTEDGKFLEAIEVCKEALALGLDDGTKTGFQGRIKRIQAKQQKHVRCVG